MGSGSYLNENFVIFLAFMLPSGESYYNWYAELKVVMFVLLLSVQRTDSRVKFTIFSSANWK